jgi:hypothetical protein
MARGAKIEALLDGGHSWDQVMAEFADGDDRDESTLRKNHREYKKKADQAPFPWLLTSAGRSRVEIDLSKPLDDEAPEVVHSVGVPPD